MAKGKIRSAVNYVTGHWNKAPEGYALPFKEWFFYCIGGMGAMGASVIPQYVTLAAGMYVAAALSIDIMHITYIGIFTSIVTILTSPLVSYMLDNTNSKYGKFRPYLIWLPIPIVLCYFILGQLTAIPSYWPMLILYAIVFNIVNFLNRVYILAFNSLIQVISPSMKERTNLMSIGTFATSLGPSIVTMLYPLIANAIYKDGDISGYNTVGAIKWIVPIMAALFCALGLLCAFNVKERIVVSKKFKQRQKFSEGVRKTVQNKYFWISNLSTVLGVFRLVSTGFAGWVITYMIFPALRASGHEGIADIMYTIVTTLISMACIPGMLLAPLLINKFGKKNLVIYSNIVCAILSVIMVIFNRSSVVLVIAMWLITLFNSVQVVTTPAIQAQIYDYQQYKTGDRLEGFISQFGTMITTVVGIGTAFITPAVYKHFGYINDANVLFITSGDTLPNIIRWMCVIGVASGVLGTIPYLFYDLTEDKHNKIMDILAVRAKHEDGVIDDEVAADLEARIKKGEPGIMAILKSYEPNADETDVTSVLESVPVNGEILEDDSNKENKVEDCSAENTDDTKI